MTGAGYGAGPAVSGRTRLGAALAALGLHVLALAAALMLGALPAGKGNRDTGHLTVIALEPPRSAATRQAPARGAPARQAVAPVAAAAETAVSSPREPAPVQAAGLPSKPAIPAAPTSIEAPRRSARCVMRARPPRLPTPADCGNTLPPAARMGRNYAARWWCAFVSAPRGLCSMRALSVRAAISISTALPCAACARPRRCRRRPMD